MLVMGGWWWVVSGQRSISGAGWAVLGGGDSGSDCDCTSTAAASGLRGLFGPHLLATGAEVDGDQRASHQASKPASNQAGSQASKQAGKQTGKQANNTPPKAANKPLEPCRLLAMWGAQAPCCTALHALLQPAVPAKSVAVPVSEL